MSEPNEHQWWKEGEQWKIQPADTEFQVGDKVVCIDDTFTKEVLMNYTKPLVKGTIYVVRGASPERVYLCGILGSVFQTIVDIEHGFRPDRFLSLSEYRRQRQNALRIYREYKQMEEDRKFMDSLDANGNPRPKRGRKPKVAPIPPTQPEPEAS